jgi:formate-dependent nitrite reductase membrane component NrfD
MSKLPNYPICLFLFSGRMRVVCGWLYLINSLQKTDSHPAVLSNSFKMCAPVVFIWFCLFFCCFRERYYSRGGERGSDNTFFFKKNSHYLTTIKTINTLVYQSLNSVFSVSWNMNLSQTVSNHIIRI